MPIPSLLATAAHPCVGGDHATYVSPRRGTFGSPPLRRGPLSRDGVHQPPDRLTPRFGGDHVKCTASISTGFGSPPRRQGAPDLPGIPDPVRRFTPASAGTTRTSRSSWRRTTVHPRLGGDHIGVDVGEGTVNGSPPRRRGPQAGLTEHLAPVRLTPASAGSTPRPGCGGSLPSAHPSSAGTTSGAQPRIRRMAVHPRVDGQHNLPCRDPCGGRGSPHVCRDHIVVRFGGWMPAGSPPHQRITSRQP